MASPVQLGSYPVQLGSYPVVQWMINKIFVLENVSLILLVITFRTSFPSKSGFTAVIHDLKKSIVSLRTTSTNGGKEETWSTAAARTVLTSRRSKD